MNAVNSFEAVSEPSRGLSNIWIAESNKGAGRFSVSTDVAYAQLVLLEGDPYVRTYEVYPDFPLKEFSVSMGSLAPLALVCSVDGDQSYIQVADDNVRLLNAIREYHSLTAQKKGFPKYKLNSPDAIWEKKILMDNWIFLSSAITRTKRYSMHREMRTAREMLFPAQTLHTVQDLLSLPNTDPAIMLGAIAILLQRGAITANLDSKVFGAATRLEVTRNE